MASSLVDLIVRVSGAAAATSAFGRIGAALGGLGRASGQTQSLTSAIAGGIIQANLLGQALSLVGNAASFMGGKFEEAKKIQLDTVSAAGTFAALTGESYKESEKFVVSFGAELSKIAGALPGATADYQRVANSIMDNVIPAFKDANGVLNKGEFQQNLTDITKQMTLLGISSGTEAGAVGMFTARLLDGNIASAKNLLFADNNPAFINLLEQEMKKRGKTLNDMKNLSARERIDVVKAVSGKLVTKDVIDAASNTVDGLIAGIQSNLFDPTSGVFGLLRDVSAAEGSQNVMTAVATSIKALMGFFDAGASILKALGVPSVDPMLVLYNGVNTFTGWVKKASSFASSLANLAKGGGGGIDGVSAIFAKIFDPDFILGGFQKLINSIQSFIKPDILVSSLQGMMSGAQKFFNPDAILNGFEKFLSGVNVWISEFFSWLANSSGKILSGGGGAIGFGVMGAKLGWFAGDMVAKLVYFVLNLPWGDIFITIGNLALAIIPAIYSAYIGFRARMVVLLGEVVVALGKALLGGLNNVWIASVYTLQEAWNPIGEQINQGIKYQIDGWGELFNYATSSTVDAWNQSTGAISAWLSSYLSGWAEVGSFAITSVQNFFASLGQAIADMWNQLLSAITGAIGSVISQAQSTITAPVTAIGNVVTNPIGAATSAATSAGQSAFNLGQNIASGAANLLGFYKGHIPTASGGLLGAFAAESRNMPSGASPVVANSSEFILTPAQMGRLMQGSAAVGASTGNTVFSPTINVYGVNDPVAIARLALEQLEIMYTQQQQGVLA